MTRFLFIILIFLCTLSASAQRDGIFPNDSSFIRKYANFDFKGKFAASIGTVEVNNYFILDFSNLSTRFERVYFMNLSFSESKIINVDPDVSKNTVCFMANKQYNVSEILDLFDRLRQSTSKIALSWSQDEKNQWLKENDKYK